MVIVRKFLLKKEKEGGVCGKTFDLKETDTSKMSNFEDPANVQELLDSMPSNSTRLMVYVNKVLPGWILKESPQFSTELGKFNLQWAHACVERKTEPTKVLITAGTFMKERDENPESYKLIREVIRRLTSAGYVVMEDKQFDCCSECQEVIVNRATMESRNYKFSGKCQKCFPYDPRSI